MRKLNTTISALALTTIILTGCGNAQSNTASNTDSAATTAASSPSASQSPTAMRIITADPTVADDAVVSITGQPEITQFSQLSDEQKTIIQERVKKGQGQLAIDGPTVIWFGDHLSTLPEKNREVIEQQAQEWYDKGDQLLDVKDVHSDLVYLYLRDAGTVGKLVE